MIYLVLVSIVWSLSFSLIKGNLTSIDPIFVAFIRLLISFLVFIPFLRIKNLSIKLIGSFIFIGGIQYGLMYLTYITSFQYLQAFEIAILTIFTPIFVVIIYDIWVRKFILLHWLTALLAVVGGGIIVYNESTQIGFWKGILFIQLSNLFFAFGQVYFKKIMLKATEVKPISIFALLYFGAVIISGIFTATYTNFNEQVVSSKQLLTLLYLGIVASGIGFYLWNVGVTKVKVGTLAILNNFKIPLGVLFALLILHETINYIQLVVGTIILIAALYFNEKFTTKKTIN